MSHTQKGDTQHKLLGKYNTVEIMDFLVTLQKILGKFMEEINHLSLASDSSPPFEIRSFRPGDEESILKLFNTVFNWGPRQFFDWKYLACPLGSKFYLGVMKGRVVCFYGGYLAKLYSKYPHFDKKLAVVIGDSTSLPRSRGRLGFVRTSKRFIADLHAQDQIAFALGFPEIGSKRLGQKTLGIKHFLEVNGLSKLLLDFLYTPRALTAEPSCRVQKFDHLPGSAVELWNNYKPALSLAVDRNLEYLRWRYETNPRSKYEFYLVSDPLQNIEGFFVVKRHATKVGQDQASEAKVMELFCPYDEPIAALRLVQGLEMALFTEQYSRIFLWLPRQMVLSKALMENGYRSFKQKEYCAYGNAGLDPENCVEHPELFYTLGDWDVP